MGYYFYKKGLNLMLKDMMILADKKLEEIAKNTDIELLEICKEAKLAFNKKNYGSEFVDFTKLSIREKTVFGWLRPDFVTIESIINGRWRYWIDVQATQKVENKDIPQLKIYDKSDAEFEVGMMMLKKCFDVFKEENVEDEKAFELFLDWILYGVGSKLVTKLPDEISDSINQHLYENFKPQYLLLYPGDYLLPTLLRIYKKKNKRPSRLYPANKNTIRLMINTMLLGENNECFKYHSLNDPCCGSGLLLLYASNKTLNLYGSDKDELAIKMCTINGYLYIPWLVEMRHDTRKLLNNMRDKYAKN